MPHRPRGASCGPVCGRFPPGSNYTVPGAGSLVVEIIAGDGIGITDLEGGQLCEIGFCGPDGRFDIPALGQRGNGHGEGLKSVLGRDGEGARRSGAALQRRGIDLGKAETLRLFGSSSPARDRVKLQACRDGVLIAAAPGADMRPDHQDTPTAIELRITRQSIPGEHRVALPEPLAGCFAGAALRRMFGNDRAVP